MAYATEYIANILKAARESRGLSQRELSRRAGVPQGHISKIESGTVDLRVSSLVALARILGLELMLVPRKFVPAVQAIAGTSPPQDGKTAHQARRALARLRNVIGHLPPDQLSETERAQLQRNIRNLQNFSLSQDDLEAIQSSVRMFKAFIDDPANRDAIREASARIRELRNSLVHDAINRQAVQIPRPAYSLNEDDHG